MCQPNGTKGNFSIGSPGPNSAHFQQQSIQINMKRLVLPPDRALGFTPLLELTSHLGRLVVLCMPDIKKSDRYRADRRGVARHWPPISRMNMVEKEKLSKIIKKRKKKNKLLFLDTHYYREKLLIPFQNDNALNIFQFHANSIQCKSI